MKLSETKFVVKVNKAFIKLLGLKPGQLAWFVREAANDLDAKLWDANEKANIPKDGLDCWLHEIYIQTSNLFKKSSTRYVVEAVPYPRGYLLLTVQGQPHTVPMPPNEDILEIKYPEALEKLLDLSNEELDITHIGGKVSDGQNRYRRSSEPGS